MHTLALVTPIVMVIYLAVTEWIPMFPFNDLEGQPVRERLGLAAINYPIFAAISVAVALGADVVALILTVLTVIGHVISWWLPYFGFSFAAQRAAYQREYSRTWKILPTEGRTWSSTSSTWW
ncbi:hypothetical protein [Sphaerisporangium fuscum]|uniref:hypothetical protein n=1 Tax=Sphaerisporangium fuscum TaxID=2835868 RepID=UPI001BDCEA80|nr:hypothetical protein [Sphaerisporangium fuscum]